MTYDLSQPLDRQSFKVRANRLYSKGVVVELTEISKKTSRQNRYLHLILGWFALENGVSLDYVKTHYFKKLCNPDIFIIRVPDQYMGEVVTMRSCSGLSKEEMSVCIDRFRNWAALEGGIYLPSPEEDDMLSEIDIQLRKNRRWV